jgi:hypothetical protein
MAKQTYSEKLQDRRWQMRRVEILLRDNFTCVKCQDSTNKQVHVHHKEYRKGLDPWDYTDSELETLCKDCHAKEHDLIPDNEPERKYNHFLLYRASEPVQLINEHINSLQEKLKEDIPDELQEEILKNIIYLHEQRKQFLAA